MDDPTSAPVPDATVESLRAEVRAALLAARDETYHPEKVLTSAGEVLGVRVPAIRAVARDLAAAHPALDVATMVRLLDAACATRGREEMLVGTFLLARSRRNLTPALWPSVDRWVEGVDNWETCDQLATGVAGEVVAKSPALVDDLVAWAGSPNRWRRRFAVSTTVALNQKGRRDPEAAFRVCAPLLADRDPMVVKAVGWTLREASQQDADATFAFLLRHRDAANSRTLREAAEKLSVEQQAALAQAVAKPDPPLETGSG